MACRTYALTRKCPDNYARITHAYLIQRSGITTFPEPTTNRASSIYHTITSDFVLDAALASGSRWQKLEFPKLNPGNFTDTPVGDPESEFYEQKVVGFYPEQDEEANANAREMFGVDIICLAVRADGKMRVIGTANSPAHIKFTESTEKGGYDVEITARSGTKSPFYEGAVSV